MSEPTQEYLDLLNEMRERVEEAQNALNAIRADLSVQGAPEEIDRAVELKDAADDLVRYYEALPEA